MQRLGQQMLQAIWKPWCLEAGQMQGKLVGELLLGCITERMVNGQLYSSLTHLLTDHRAHPRTDTPPLITPQTAQFLGNFVPEAGQPALWELDSDYYLHSGPWALQGEAAAARQAASTPELSRAMSAVPVAAAGAAGATGAAPGAGGAAGVPAVEEEGEEEDGEGGTEAAVVGAVTSVAVPSPFAQAQV